MERIDSIIKKINQKSQRPIENEKLFREYVLDCLNGKKAITFYNWECPPRILDKDKKGKIFLNFCVDLEKVFKGEKIDDYTETPRVVAEKIKETKILNFLKSLGLKFRFMKIIADTNAYYIMPESLKILGKEKIENTFMEFKKKIDAILKRDYKFIETESVMFTDLIKKYRNEYENAMLDALNDLCSDKTGLIKSIIWQNQLKYIKRHLGFKDYQRKEMINFTKKTIATYGAEGVVFDLLSKTKRFSNCVWLNIEEPSLESIEIINCLRNKKGLGKLPMIFPK